MQSKLVKLLRSIAISSGIILVTMVFLNARCQNDCKDACDSPAVEFGKKSSGKCADTCGDKGYANYYISDGCCCCWN